MKKFIFLIFCIFLIRDSYAFNWNVCRASIMGPGDITGIPGITSTTQFTSSWGECRMIGQIDNDQKVFIAQTWNQLQIDSSKGNGEYINAFAVLSGCNENGAIVLKHEMQKNFQQIYGKELDSSVEETHQEIKKLFINNEALKKNCAIKS